MEMKIRALFLDDVRKAPMGWDVARTAADFYSKVSAEPVYDVMSLDHDLGNDKIGDGTYVADWLARNMDKMPKLIFIHSANPVGAERMYKILQPHTQVWKAYYKDLMAGSK